MRRDKTWLAYYESEIGMKLHILPKCLVQGHRRGDRGSREVIFHISNFRSVIHPHHIFRCPSELTDSTLNQSTED